MKVEELRAFVAITEAGGILAASRKTKMPPASLARRLKELEEYLGVILVERTTHSAFVTQWGRALYPHALDALAAIAQAEEAMRGLHEMPLGHLRVLAPSAFGRRMIAPLLADFGRAYPDIRVTLLLDNSNPDLNSADVDIAFRIGGEPVGAERFERLGTCELIAVAAPRYLSEAGRVAAPADLQDHRIVALSTDGREQTWCFSRSGSMEKVAVVPSISVFDPTAVLDIILDGGGIALVSEIFCNAEIAEGRLQVVLPGWRHEPGQEYIMSHARAVSELPRAQVFMDHVRKALREKLKTNTA